MVSELDECCPQHSTLLSLVKTSGLYGMLDETGPYTFIAPTNSLGIIDFIIVAFTIYFRYCRDIFVIVVIAAAVSVVFAAASVNVVFAAASVNVDVTAVRILLFLLIICCFCFCLKKNLCYVAMIDGMHSYVRTAYSS